MIDWESECHRDISNSLTIINASVPRMRPQSRLTGRGSLLERHFTYCYGGLHDF
jgi:hypothetical protein